MEKRLRSAAITVAASPSPLLHFLNSVGPYSWIASHKSLLIITFTHVTIHHHTSQNSLLLTTQASRYLQARLTTEAISIQIATQNLTAPDYLLLRTEL